MSVLTIDSKEEMTLSLKSLSMTTRRTKSNLSRKSPRLLLRRRLRSLLKRDLPRRVIKRNLVLMLLRKRPLKKPRWSAKRKNLNSNASVLLLNNVQVTSLRTTLLRKKMLTLNMLKTCLLSLVN